MPTIVICSPTLEWTPYLCARQRTHADIMVAAAAAGKMPVCGKTHCLDMAEVDRALAAVERAGVPLQIGFNRRWDPLLPGYGRLWRMAPWAGYISCTSSAVIRPATLSYVLTSGGLFADMTIHDFDMARFLVGSEVDSVFVRGASGSQGNRRGWNIDTAVVVLPFTTVHWLRSRTAGRPCMV